MFPAECLLKQRGEKVAVFLTEDNGDGPEKQYSSKVVETFVLNLLAASAAFLLPCLVLKSLCLVCMGHHASAS